MDANQALKTASSLYSQLSSRRTEVEELDQYFRGEQPLVYASPEWAEFHHDRYKGFADNWCGPVASAPAERLALTGVRLADGTNKRAASRLWADWQRNDGDAQSSQGFLQSIVAKRSFTIVWGSDDNEPEFTWEHPSQVLVDYDPANRRRRRAAVKAWIDEGSEYLTLYEPENLWKFKRKASGVKVTNGVTDGGLHVVGRSDLIAGGSEGWEPHQPKDDDEWPLPNPLGEVNVIEWPNRPLLGNEPVSDIEGTKAMQDAINLLWAYLFGAADHASMPGRVITGAAPPQVPILDNDGNVIGSRNIEMKDLQQKRFLWLTGEKSGISEFTAAKLDVFTQVIEEAVSHIAAQTRTPSHYLINGDNVPAAGYELAEAGLVEKVKEFWLFSQAPARDHFRLMAKVRGEDKLAESLRTSTMTWANPAVRSDAQLSDALLKKRQTGYPLEYLLELDGASPSEVERIMGMVRAEQNDPYLALLADKGAANADAESAPVRD